MNGYEIVDEVLEREIHNGSTARSPIMSVHEGKVTRLISTVDPDRKEADRTFNDSELAITQLQDRMLFPDLYHLRQTLMKLHSFRGLSWETIHKLGEAQILMPIHQDHELRFSDMGEGIVSVIQALVNQSEFAPLYERFKEVMLATFSDMESIDVRVVAGGRATLTFQSHRFHGRVIPLSSMSDGVLRFMALTLLLILPADAPILTIDEPEAGLHPRMMAPLVELLRISSEYSQIIVSTHSAELISRLQPDDVITVENEFGQSTMRRHTMDDLASWLERYTLGELWTMGRLTYS
jgi:predicted ATPase